MFDNIVAVPEWGTACLTDEDGNVVLTFIFQDGEVSVLW